MKFTGKFMLAAALFWAGCDAWSNAQPAAPANNAENESVVEEDPVPPDVPASAIAAVARLGDEVVLGRYQVAIDRMNPLWMERAASTLGSKEELKRKIDGVAAEMVRRGISMISFKPQGQPIVYQVAPGKRPLAAGGSSLGYTKWLLLVPTSTRFRIMTRVEGGPPRSVTIEKIGFQAAISDKAANDWTFIDGAGLKVADLRGLFPTLPMDMKMPPVGEREVR